MEKLRAFLIPLLGLKDDIHHFDFQLDKNFFSQFENSPVSEGLFQVKLTLDKRPNLLVLDFNISGTTPAKCDRCLSAINYPVEDQQQLIFKYAESYKEEAEVVYLANGTTEINVAKYIFECVCLAVPMLKYCEASDQDCSDEMLKYLDHQEAPEVEESTENPLWDELKKFNHKK
ncbi:MAG: DUF177 domain-containing protein [Saprospiraceae bacterium]